MCGWVRVRPLEVSHSTIKTMPPLRLEVATQNDTWHEVGDIDAHDPPESMTNRTPAGREIYTFYVDAAAGRGVIVKSEADATDSAIASSRIVGSIGRSVVASLAPGESHELLLVTDQSSGELRHLKLTYYE